MKYNFRMFWGQFDTWLDMRIREFNVLNILSEQKQYNSLRQADPHDGAYAHTNVSTCDILSILQENKTHAVGGQNKHYGQLQLHHKKCQLDQSMGSIQHIYGTIRCPLYRGMIKLRLMVSEIKGFHLSKQVKQHYMSGLANLTLEMP